MRIVAGHYRGRKLVYPDSRAVRPTQDRVREALFNIITALVPGATVLDLFAGSGAMGLEALSRGAEKATFVDNNFKCIDCIGRNVESIGVEDRVTIMRRDWAAAMDKFRKNGEKFDIIMADPPYYMGIPKKVLIKLDAYDIVSQNNIIIIERHCKDTIPEKLRTIAVYDERKYGDTVLSFYRKKEQNGIL